MLRKAVRDPIGAVPRFQPAVLWLALAALAIVGIDVFRLGFFADDFHLLDSARRIPVLELLTGKYGIWPWFRPLSRELYFEVVQAAGAHAFPVARTLSLLCLTLTAWMIWRVGRRLAPPPAAEVAALAFLCFSYTKFLAGWASGFQDLLSVMLVVAALDAFMRGAGRLAALCCFLAAFAKETGFVAVPLLAIYAYVFDCKERFRRLLPLLAGVISVAILIHVAIRTQWVTEGSEAVMDPRLEHLGSAVLDALRGIFTPGLPRQWLAGLPGLLSGLAAFLLIWQGGKPMTGDAAGPHPDQGRFVLFNLAGVIVGAAPVIAGHLAGLTSAYAYYLYPAVPWAALLLGFGIARLPRNVLLLLVPALVVLNSWGLAYVAPDLDRPGSWKATAWSWPEAVRLAAVAERLGSDMQTHLASRPESLVVLFEEVPLKTFLQTDDGPAIRTILRDPSVRSAWINEPPADVQRERLAILTFDAEQLRLHPAHWTSETSVQRASNALIAGRGRATRAFAMFGDAGDGLSRSYLIAAATLLEEGPEAYEDAFVRSGMGDSLRLRPLAVYRALGAVDDTIRRAVQTVVQNPSLASSHLALAQCHVDLLHAAVELRIALALDPTYHGARYALAESMIALGGGQEAVDELTLLLQESVPATIRDAAQTLLLRLQPRDPGGDAD